MPVVFGVEAVLGIFLILGSMPRFRMSLTDTAEPWPLGKLPDSQSCGDGIISV
jgi:hypothetical protein